MDRVHIKRLLLDFGENRVQIGCWDCRSGSTTSHWSGVHDGTVPEIKPDGSTIRASALLWIDLYAHNAIEFYPPASPSRRTGASEPVLTEAQVSAKISKGPPGTA